MSLVHVRECSYGWRRWRPKCLQCLNKPLWFLLFISLSSFFQGAVINGFVNVSLSSIERRFGVSSKAVGMISASFEISGLVIVIPVAYYGGRSSQPRILGICLALLASGCFLMCVPHLGTFNKWSAMDEYLQNGNTSYGFCNSSDLESEVSQILTKILVFASKKKRKLTLIILKIITKKK